MGIARPLAIFVAATAATALVAGLTSAPASAASTYDPQPVKAGAGWLADQLTDGLVHNEQFDFDDFGPVHRRRPRPRRRRQEADGRQGDHQGRRQERRLLHDLQSPPTCTPAPPPRPPCSRWSQGKNPRAFGGVDLVTQLEGRVATAAPITGRIEDAYDPTDQFGGDFANVIGQAYAAQALAPGGSAKAGAATAFLLQQQCAKGYFRQYFTADKTRPDQSCQGAPQRRARRQHRRDRARRPRAAGRQGRQGQGGREEGRRVARRHPARRRCVHRHRQVEGRRQLQQHRPGRLGARRGRRRPSRRPRRPRGCATSRCRRQPVRAQAGQADRCDRLRRRRPTAPPRASGIKKKDSDQWRRASAQALPVLRWAPRAEGDFTATAPAHRSRRATAAASGSRAWPRVSASA